MNYAMVQFQPGQDSSLPQHHGGENFHILQGKIDIVVDGEVHTLRRLHPREPGEVHYVNLTPYDEPIVMRFILSGSRPLR